MSKKRNRSQMLGSMKVSKALIAMGLPMMVGMMVNAIYNLVDAYFVGGLGTSQMGAIAVAFPLGQAIVGIGLLFGNGASSYISRLLGAQDLKKANQVASTSIYSSLVVGIIVICFSLIFMKPILFALGATESIMPYAYTYATIYIASCIFNIFNVTMNNIVTSEGSPKITMFALLLGACMNVILDPICIYTLGFGVAGAAIATAISQICSTCVYVCYILKKMSVFSFKLKDVVISKEIYTQIMKIGVPTLIFQLLTSVAISLVNLKANPYGDSVIAALGATTRIISMGSLIVFGFLKGFQPIAGYSFGAKNFERLRASIKLSCIWSTIFCICFGVLTSIFAQEIIMQFTSNDVHLIEVGVHALQLNGLSFILFGYYTVYSSLYLALGKGLQGFILGACRQGICFIPMILLLPEYFGIDGIVYAQPVADILSFIVAVVMGIQLNKEIKKLEKAKLSDETSPVL
ncbi:MULTISPECIES: MATE family efflux transporter [unclassified Breznakia]|uniref:MATE family efflux transporter n=1 Tax=unclassified Breznakia TaxID=2623764 RepID=UPI002476647C|nr:MULTISPECIES: MATE family efflux transporter [unclassified Breznakia]MDH6366942.1 putative MATE family efflux protein [Breznakia sp. PH1-1]MDH6404120.1 putative MATE family efflux protein [Breznakia sp. PF1-11]MDH6411829.1 putative MATE family efflux protein [Breznakia sp. PFB1-11]MDH6414108.1 putative MATE family efflux protein [Breznakia sp. PFB1-14]MDH6416535.1 putative MATE family efflux protein [Breznakia sp. PFB1-4]